MQVMKPSYSWRLSIGIDSKTLDHITVLRFADGHANIMFKSKVTCMPDGQK